MASHAESPIRTNGVGTSSSDYMVQVNGDSKQQHRSMLHTTDPNELHDLICVGFGPASLAIAAALHDSIEFSSQPQQQLPKVAFLERQPEFAWHAGMQLPGAKMQISWVKDLATLRNPRSQFTFLNYLHSAGRLVQFTNLSTFLPLRLEYEAYMKWCAKWFEHLTAYSQEGIEVIPQNSKGSKLIDSFTVRSRNISTSEIETRRARNVVIAVGGKPKMPTCFPQSSPRVIPSSSYAWSIPRLFSERDGPYRFAILGAGQSAGEIFHDLQSRYPNCRATLMIKGSALRPSDDSPFVNEIFNAEHTDDLYNESSELRSADIREDRPTNYGVVRLELLEKIYADLYEQRLHRPGVAEGDLPHRILPHREVLQVEEVGKEGLRLRVKNRHAEHSDATARPIEDVMAVDAVIVATGYSRDMHEDLLANARSLMPGGDAKGKKWSVRRDYGVKFEEGAFANDVGVWLQGCNESTHGLSDSLLSILAMRGAPIESVNTASSYVAWKRRDFDELMARFAVTDDHQEIPAIEPGMENQTNKPYQGGFASPDFRRRIVTKPSED